MPYCDDFPFYEPELLCNSGEEVPEETLSIEELEQKHLEKEHVSAGI